MPSTPTLDSPRVAFGALSDVPEESSSSGRASPYTHPALSGSTSTFKAHPSTSSLASLASSSASKSPTGPRSPAGLRGSSSRVVSDTASIAGASIAGVLMQSSTKKSRSKSPGSATIREREREKDRERDREKDKDREKDGRPEKTAQGVRGSRPQQRIRNTPHLPVAKDVEPVPPTLMYWSRAPVYGLLPTHGLRAHSVTLVDNVAWIFGGCDEKGCWADVWTFHVGTL